MKYAKYQCLDEVAMKKTKTNTVVSATHGPESNCTAAVHFSTAAVDSSTERRVTRMTSSNGRFNRTQVYD